MWHFTIRKRKVVVWTVLLLSNICNGGTLCFLWGREWIFKYSFYLDELRASNCWIALKLSVMNMLWCFLYPPTLIWDLVQILSALGGFTCRHSNSSQLWWCKAFGPAAKSATAVPFSQIESATYLLTGNEWPGGTADVKIHPRDLMARAVGMSGLHNPSPQFQNRMFRSVRQEVTRMSVLAAPCLSDRI
jgi:hypothetical protein